ncbi:MAG TPA: serine hydrolase domain-containing protein [Puia sp.]|nr:serine hydrolase domain-containing protein [Puia sp.]
MAQSSKVAPSTSPEMDAFLTGNQKLFGSDVIAYAYKDGKIVYKKEIEKEVGNFNGRVQVPAGVASQWLVAATIMAYVDEGKISLDDKVSKYIPIFSKYMKTYITIRNCLSFTTGIHEDPPGPLKLLEKSKYPDLETEVNAFASKRDIESNPGTEIFYSQIGPDIAARVLEVITKKTFDRCVSDKILRPCKMRGTSFTNDNGLVTNAATGAVTTASDYINFLGMLLNKGMFEGKMVLSEKSIADMETIQYPALPVKYMPKEAAGLKLGLGCWIDNGNTVTSLNLTGFYPYVDRRLNYAALLVPKKSDEPKKELYVQFRQKMDAAFGK